MILRTASSGTEARGERCGSHTTGKGESRVKREHRINARELEEAGSFSFATRQLHCDGIVEVSASITGMIVGSSWDILVCIFSSDGQQHVTSSGHTNTSQQSHGQQTVSVLLQDPGTKPCVSGIRQRANCTGSTGGIQHPPLTFPGSPIDNFLQRLAKIRRCISSLPEAACYPALLQSMSAR